MRLSSCFWVLWAGVLSAPLVLATALLSSQPAYAEADEITVTARKREENLQSVPISISAFTDEDLRVRGIVDLKALADQTPGLSFATSGPVTSSRAVIRGMSQQTRVGDETNVATFVDGVYTPGFSGAEFFGADGLERIEVLKGPQSALYGRNSFAGAINYVTAKPSLDYEYGGRLTVGDGERRGLTSFVSGPIFNDQLATRVDVGHNSTGGSFKNNVNGERLGNVDTTYARFGSLWDVGDNTSITVSLSWQKDDDSTGTPSTLVADDDPVRIGKRATVSPFEAFAGLFTGGRLGRLYNGKITDTTDNYFVDPRAKSGDRTVYRGAITIEHDLETTQLISITSYQRRQVEVLNDFNNCRVDIRSASCDLVSPTAIGTFFGGPIAGGFVVSPVLTGVTEDRAEISQDLRLQSTGGDALQWTAGVYFSSESFRDNRHRISDVTLTSPDGSIVYATAWPAPLVDSSALFNNDFYSIYGSVNYDYSDAWSFSAEGRYTRENKLADEQQNSFPSNVPPTGLLEEDFGFFTPRFIVNYQPSDAAMMYASIARGVKSGGFNPGSVSKPTFDEESNWTYEVGSKFTFADGDATLNSAVYFVDWDDQQVTATDPDNNRLPITVNVAKTEILGGELDLFYQATDWLRLNFGASYIDAEYKEGFSTSTALMTDCADLPIPCDLENPPGSGNFVTSGSLAGLQVIGAPKTSITSGIQLNLPLASGSWEFQGRLDHSWKDKVYIDDANSGYIGARHSVNLRLGIRNDQWTVDSYCNNLTDDDTPVFAAPPRDILGVPHYAVINREGRRCGIQIGFRN